VTIPLGGSYPDFVSEELRRTLSEDEAIIGIVLEQAGKSVFVAPSLSGRNPEWTKHAASSDLVLIDGTFWSDDELKATGRSKKTAREMGHLPLSGPGGLLEQFPRNARGRRILIHINNTNPILDEESAEHRAVLDAGFEIAYDGMEFKL
jgi:pyrroloquinoline quinone biosynthesis protein B